MDRQDIDALLIGALYGELTPADEARLTAHLESHPADKTALDDLKSARERVRSSRIFEAQTEPPQAISAMLLQEAARRAPKQVVAKDGERESWFFRFMRSFAAHPAMAAAAMLVVVVGVAGTLYMKNGAGGFAEKTASTPAETTTANAEMHNDQGGAPAAAPVVSADAGAPALALGKDQAEQAQAEGAAAGSGYEVGLADRGQLERKEAETREKTEVADTEKKAVHAATKGAKRDYIPVTTPEPQPKEMPSDDKALDGDGFAKAPAYDNSRARGGGGAPATGTASTIAGPSNAAPGGAPAQVAQAPVAPPPPPAVYKNAPAKPSAAPSKTVAKAPPPKAAAEPAPEQQAPAEATPPADTSLIAWAKEQHAQAIQRVRNNDCTGAANIVVSVLNRAPGYYSQNMQNDRALKGCQSYIADAVNRDEERSSKPKAAKRAADDEAPAAIRSK